MKKLASLMAIMAMTSSMSGDSNYNRGLYEKTDAEKRTESLLTKTRYEDKYPDIKLHPKLKKNKTWEEIQELKRLKYEQNNRF